MEQRGNDNPTGKPKYSEKINSLAVCSPHTPHGMFQTWIRAAAVRG